MSVPVSYKNTELREKPHKTNGRTYLANHQTRNISYYLCLQAKVPQINIDGSSQPATHIIVSQYTALAIGVANQASVPGTTLPTAQAGSDPLPLR